MSDLREPDRSPVLNDNQRRHFEVLLSMLEDSLARIDELCSEPSTNRTLTIVNDDLPPKFAVDAEPLMTSIRARVVQLAAALNLSPRSLSKRRAIATLLTAEVIRIEDSAPERLRGYGSVDPRFADEIAPQLREIREELARLSSMLRSAEGHHRRHSSADQ